MTFIMRHLFRSIRTLNEPVHLTILLQTFESFLILCRNRGRYFKHRIHSDISNKAERCYKILFIVRMETK